MWVILLLCHWYSVTIATHKHSIFFLQLGKLFRSSKPSSDVKYLLHTQFSATNLLNALVMFLKSLANQTRVPLQVLDNWHIMFCQQQVYLAHHLLNHMEDWCSYWQVGMQVQVCNTIPLESTLWYIWIHNHCAALVKNPEGTALINCILLWFNLHPTETTIHPRLILSSVTVIIIIIIVHRFRFNTENQRSISPGLFIRWARRIAKVGDWSWC